MVNFQSDAMLVVHFSTAMRYRLFLEQLNIAIVAFVFLDHRERLFFDYFAHLRIQLESRIFESPFKSILSAFCIVNAASDVWDG